MEIDVLSVRPQGPYWKAWSRYIFTTLQAPDYQSNGKYYKSVIQLNYYNCKAGNQAAKQVNFRDAADLVVASYTYMDAQLNFTDPVPETMGEYLQDFVCRTRGKQ